MGKTAPIAILAFAAMLGTAWAAPSTAAIVAEVQAALDRGDAQHAVTLADSALREDTSAGERGRLLLYLGLGHELLGKTDAAMADFTRALGTQALAPDERAQALLQRGFLHDGQNHLEEAAADYTAVIALKGDSAATALNNRANILRRQNRLADARRDYQAALAAGGGKAQYSWYGLGQIAEAQQDMLAARGFYARAVAADPGYALASERLAALGGAPDGAIANADVITLHPPPVTFVKALPPSATQASKDEDGTVILRAPSSAKARGEPVALRQPMAKPAARRLDAVSLRPALDATASGNRAGQNMPQVQLGAWRSEAEAQQGWIKAKARAGGVLKAQEPQIVTAELPGRGRYYRLRATPPDGDSPARFCAALTAQGVACLPVRD